MALSDQQPRQPFLTANATRIRWLARERHSVNRWKQWQSEAVERDKENLVPSSQLLGYLQRLLRLDTIIGMHPLQAAGAFPTAWMSGEQREGWT